MTDPTGGTPTVAGHCPMGCGRTLTLDHAHVTCTSPRCPRPTAVHDILADDETEHVVTFADGGTFLVVHPLRETLGSALECPANGHVTRMQPMPPGRYRMTRIPCDTPGCVCDDDTWTWQVLGQEGTP